MQLAEHKLRALLRRKVLELSDKVIKSNGYVTAQSEESLTRLARLVKLVDATGSHPPPKRWPMVAAFAISLVIVSVLLYARVAEMEVELELTLSEVGFEISGDHLLTQRIPLVTIGVTGLREIQVPRSRFKAAYTRMTDDPDGLSARVSVADLHGDVKGMMSLAPLTFSGGTKIRISRSGMPRQFTLTLACRDAVIHVDVTHTVNLGWTNLAEEKLELIGPKLITMKSAKESLEMDFQTVTGGLFSPSVAISNLSLLSVDRFQDAEHTLVRQMSTIISGTIFMESMNGESFPLRHGELIQFRKVQGEIRNLTVQDDKITLNFHGKVTGLTSGAGENRRSLMPSYLEWLHANHGLSLFWGAALYLFGLIITFSRWWGNIL